MANLNKAAEFWLDEYLLPITPNSFTIKNTNQNETTQSVDGTPITIARRDPAQSFTLSFLIPIYLERVKNNYVIFSDSKILNRKTLTDYLWTLKWERKDFVFTAIYPDGSSLNGRFLLDDYEYKQDATNGSDYEFTIGMTEYYPAQNTEVDSNLVNSLIALGIRNPRRLD